MSAVTIHVSNCDWFYVVDTVHYDNVFVHSERLHSLRISDKPTVYG